MRILDKYFGKKTQKDTPSRPQSSEPLGDGAPTAAEKPTGQKPKLDVQALKRLLSYVGRSYRLQFAFVLFCIIVSAVTGAMGSLFLQVLIDDYILPLVGQANPDFLPLIRLLAQMAGIYALGVVSVYLYNRIMTVIAQGILKKIRDEMFIKMQGFAVKYFDTHSFGDTMSHFTNDSDTLRQMFAFSVPQMFSSAISLVTVFSAMLMTSMYLSGVVLVFVGGIILFIKKMGSKSSTYFFAQQKVLGELNGYIEETVSGQRVVKVFCHEDAAIEDFDQKAETLREHAGKANILANIIPPSLGNIGHLQYSVLAVVGGAMAISGVGGLTIGGLVAFLQLSRGFVMPINVISQQVNLIIMALAGAKRIFTLMDETPEEDDGDVTLVHVTQTENGLTEAQERTGVWAWKLPEGEGADRYVRLEGDVRFVHVDFSYVAEKPVLRDISLYAHPGQKVAFVGATGAGKTTIANLINQFYRIDSGEILYDGIDIRRIRKADLRRSLGVVLQETNLFTGTVMENIRYGKPDATDEEVREAARIAGAEEFILRLPNKYDTEIQGNGDSLSQGQRQLLSIARAAVANPPVMILDEATSSIDTRTESIVQRGMDSLMQGRTVFVIAHRLSTVQNANVIMLLDNGSIIERGTHDMLLEEHGRYYRLYAGSVEET